MVSKDLLDLLVCALCKSDLALEAARLRCLNGPCGCVYKIEDDIPNMLVEEADRPCPSCKAQRDWDPDHDTLKCPKCAATFTWQAPPVQ